MGKDNIQPGQKRVRDPGHPSRLRPRRSVRRVDAADFHDIDLCLRDGGGRRSAFSRRAGRICVHGRTRNPTQALFEERIASLEGAEFGLAVASGMAAISSTLWTLVAVRVIRW